MEILSRGGVPVYPDYRENIVVDPAHPVLAWKANKERFSPTLFPPHIRALYADGLPRIGSRHSEDAVSWNLFGSLQLAGRLSLIADFIAAGSDFDILYFWARDASRWSDKVDPDIQECLNKMEPWGKDGMKQQTETDVILRGKKQIVLVECKLGKPGAKFNAWGRSREGDIPEDYRKFMEGEGINPFGMTFDYHRDGKRFYQLFRNYLLGTALSKKWGTGFSLLAVVSKLNCNQGGRSHEDEFHSFRSLLLTPSNASLITWQDICRALPDDPRLEKLRGWLFQHPLLGLCTP